MKKIVVTLLSVAAFGTAFAAEMTDDQKTLYAVGSVLGQQLSVFQLTPAELEIVKRGISDAIAGKKPEVAMETYGPRIQPLAQSRRAALSAKQAAAGKTFAEKAAKEKGAVKTASGLIYIPLKEGTGASPAATDTVKVHYRGTLVDGKEFDSSYSRGNPIEFPLSGVIKCWGEGVAKMKVGGKARLVCPPDIAYGDNGAGASIPPGATLNFEVELLDIVKAPPAAAPALPEPAKK